MRPALRLPLAALPAAALLAAAALAGCDNADPDPTAEAEVTVMTRNLYLGADLFTLLQAQTPEQVPALAGALWADVLASDFSARAGALAAEIEAHGPDLVGLQEVSLYRTQAPSDYAASPGPNAEAVALDFLSILQDSLAARGPAYTAVATNTNADVELPAIVAGEGLVDVRLTDHDVILARAGVATAGATSQRFNFAAEIPIGGGEIPFVRGYSLLTATVDSVDFTFVNTHLEVAAGEAVNAQIIQANELRNALRSRAGIVVAVGDFNSDPAEAGQGGDSYRLLTGGEAPFADAWTAGGGFTCCQAADLRNEASALSERIDLVLHRGDVTVLDAEVVGEEPGDRTGGGLWPSDHAGVVATLRLRD